MKQYGFVPGSLSHENSGDGASHHAYRGRLSVKERAPKCIISGGGSGRIIGAFQPPTS